MIKKIVIGLIVLFSCVVPSYAEKIPVKIAPIQVISTHHDAVQVGDWVQFVVVNDVYLKDELFIKKNTNITGVVDYVHQNGWGGDSATVYFKKFYVTDVNNKKNTIEYPLEITGNAEMTNDARQITSRVLSAFSYFAFIFRGAEIYVEPDTKTYNLFIER